MALYIGNADSKPQYVAGLFYGDANNKPVRVVAGWVGDENNKPRLFYSPNLEYTVDAYGADWWGGEFYINMLNVSGGTGRYRYKFTLTVEGQDPQVYESPEPTRATSCSYTFTLPNAGTYATWEATVMDAANAHCRGSQSGRFDVVRVPFVMGCEAAQISIYTNGVWKATIYSNVLKNYDITKVKASVKDVDDDDRTVECAVDYYEEKLDTGCDARFVDAVSRDIQRNSTRMGCSDGRAGYISQGRMDDLHRWQILRVPDRYELQPHRPCERMEGGRRRRSGNA